MRLHILGAPGSGKTTLARAAGERYGVRVWDLDWLVYDGETGRERPPDDLHHQIRSVLDNESWITEGAYHQGQWLQELLTAADLIIWLDLAWRTRAVRMAKRHLRLTLTGQNPHPGTIKFLRFLNYTRLAGMRMDESTLARVAPFAEKLVHCRSNADVGAAWGRLSELGPR